MDAKSSIIDIEFLRSKGCFYSQREAENNKKGKSIKVLEDLYVWYTWVEKINFVSLFEEVKNGTLHLIL